MKSSSRNGAKVIWLGLHTTEGMMRVQTLRDWVAWPGSSHAACDETGALWGPEKGFVPYDRASWTLRNGNAISENLEQCGWAKWTRAEWLARPKLLDATARWLAERSKARGIPLRRLTHAEVRARVPGVLMHDDYSKATGDGTHWDCGPGYPWDVVLAKAIAYRNGTQEDDLPYSEADLTRIIRTAVWDAIEANPDDGDSNTMGNQTRRMAERIGGMVGHRSMQQLEQGGGLAGLVWGEQIPDADRAARTGGKETTSSAREFLIGAASEAFRARTGVQSAIAANDPAKLAEAIRNSFDDDLVADVAARLTITPAQ